MPKLLFVISFVCLSVPGAIAQRKIDSRWNCGKVASGYTLAIPDEPDHAYAIGQFVCTAAKGEVDGVKETHGIGTQFDDMQGTTARFHGVFVETLADGDKIYIDYQGTGAMMNALIQSANKTWSIRDGTGKFKGAKGKGSCKGKFKPDGSSRFDCVGSYTLAK